MAIRVELLKAVPAFDRLAPSIQNQLAQEASIAAYQHREMLYAQGDDPTGLYALVSGHVKLYRQSRERDQILALLIPGDCFGAESLTPDTPSSYSVTAITPISTLYIRRETLLQLLDDCPDLRTVILQLVSSRLRQFATLVHSLAFRDVTARLATVLLMRAESQGELTPQGVRFERLLTQQELAAMVGTAREVVYRTFKKLEKDNIIRVSRNQIIIYDIERLTQIANEETR